MNIRRIMNNGGISMVYEGLWSFEILPGCYTMGLSGWVKWSVWPGKEPAPARHLGAQGAMFSLTEIMGKTIPKSLNQLGALV